MKNSVLKLLVVLLPCLAVGLYIFNPSGTSSNDPRARIFGVVPFRIPSSSMEPTIKVGDLILVNAYAYRSEPLRRGDIIVFKYPPDPKQKYIMRLIGLPEENITIENSRVFVDGREIVEPYTQHIRSTEREPQEWTIPRGKLFVLGDNRDNSSDSRYWGFVDLEEVVGRVNYIWYSPKGETGAVPRLKDY